MAELFALKVFYKGRDRFLSEDPVNGGLYPINFAKQLKIWDVHYANMLPWLKKQKMVGVSVYQLTEKDKAKLTFHLD